MPKKKTKASRLIDAYIKEAPAFARPICRKLRKLIHQADHDIMEEWKWGPHFFKKGMVCGFGAFKNHVSIAFFKGALMKDPYGLFTHGLSSHYNRAVHFTSKDQIDEIALIEYFKEAIAINETGIKIQATSQVVSVPDDLHIALSANPIALENFNGFDYNKRREYVKWIENCRQQETREKRIRETVMRAALNQKMHEDHGS